MGWIAAIGAYDVQRRESPRPGGKPYIPLTAPKAFIVHTTEGDSVDSAWNTLNSRGSAPHFLIGENRIVQMRPLDVQAATLVTDSSAGFYANSLGWQVECVGHASQRVHRLTLPTWAPLVALTRFMHERKGIPLRRPDGWRDDLSDITTILASNNTRRQSRVAIGFRGILDHLGIPAQSPTWHWDAGALDYSALFAEVTEGDDMDGADLVKGITLARRGKPLPDDATFAMRQGYWLVQEIREARTLPEPGVPGPHDHPEYDPSRHKHPTGIGVPAE